MKLQRYLETIFFLRQAVRAFGLENIEKKGVYDGVAPCDSPPTPPGFSGGGSAPPPIDKTATSPQRLRDAEALSVLDQLGQAPEMHRRNSDYHAYEYFVVHRT